MQSWKPIYRRAMIWPIIADSTPWGHSSGRNRKDRRRVDLADDVFRFSRELTVLVIFVIRVSSFSIYLVVHSYYPHVFHQNFRFCPRCKISGRGGDQLFFSSIICLRILDTQRLLLFHDSSSQHGDSNTLWNSLYCQNLVSITVAHWMLPRTTDTQVLSSNTVGIFIFMNSGKILKTDFFSTQIDFFLSYWRQTHARNPYL